MKEIKAAEIKSGMRLADDDGQLFRVVDVQKGFVRFETPSGRMSSVIITYEDGVWEQIPRNQLLQVN